MIENHSQFVCPILEAEFVLVPGGKFVMGDVWGGGGQNEMPLHDVTIPSFYMSKYTLIQGECLEILGEIEELSLELTGCDWDMPRNFASWDLAQELISLINHRSNNRYRLPSEAEWEYAASCGRYKHKYSGTDFERNLPDYAIYGLDENVASPVEVGQRHPNEFGLYDMSGNVWEWCEDAWHDNYIGAPTDGSPWLTGGDSDRRVIKGGSFASPAHHCRVSHRSWCRRIDGHKQIGIRLCLNIK